MVAPSVPDHEWLCPECVSAGLFIIDSVVDKRVRRGITAHLVEYAGIDQPEWQGYPHLSKQGGGIRKLLVDYNRHLRESNPN